MGPRLTRPAESGWWRRGAQGSWYRRPRTWPDPAHAWVWDDRDPAGWWPGEVRWWIRWQDRLWAVCYWSVAPHRFYGSVPAWRVREDPEGAETVPPVDPPVDDGGPPPQ